MTPADHTALTWAPPGKGSWNLVADHYPRAVTPTVGEFARVWSDASLAYMKQLGLPVERAEMSTVNGLPYVCIDGGGGGSKTPPAWLLKVLVHVIPSLRRSQKRLTEVLSAKPWVDGVERWYSVQKPAALARMRTLTEIDPTSLDDDALAAHVHACRDEAMRSGHEHISLHGHDTLPPGLFVISAMDWGLDQQTALSLLAGSSPASAGRTPERVALVEAIAGRPATSLEELWALGPDVSAALDEFLLVHGCRVVDGYDVDSSTLAEHPPLVVAIATSPPPPTFDAERAATVAAARERIPAEHHAEFDSLLARGRSAYGVRDDNSAILTAWPMGLVRRSLLAAGDRLVARGALHDRTDALELSADEVAGALRGTTPLDADVVRQCGERRRATRAADAPSTLGPPQPPIPVGMPGALGTVMRVFAIYDFYGASRTGALTGTGIGDGVYTGPVRLVPGGAIGIAEFEPGDVLVAPMTSPSYNTLLSLAGAVVTEAGGVLSHAGIMARELGLPAVLGVANATSHLRDGETVTVDAAAGRITRAADAPR